MAHLLLSFHANHDINHGSQVSFILTLRPTPCFPSVNLNRRRHTIASYHSRSYNYADRIFLTLRYPSDQTHTFSGQQSTLMLMLFMMIVRICIFGTNLVWCLYTTIVSHSYIPIVHHPMESVIVIFFRSMKGLDYYITRCDCDSSDLCGIPNPS
jgi:hypothetical protein